MKKIAVLVFVFSVLCSSRTQAQAWGKAKGEGFFKLDFTAIKAQNVFDNFGKIVPFRTLGNYTTAIYGEYGLGNKITIFSYAPLFVSNQLAATQGAQTGTIISAGAKRNGIGDIDLGIRYPLLTGKWSVSLNVMFGLPTGNSTDVNALFTGDGEFNQLAKINVGTGATRWWTQGGIGFNNRTKNNSDEIRYDLELGYKFLDERLLAMLKISGIQSLNNGAGFGAATGLYSNNVEYTGIGPEVLYYLNRSKKYGISGRVAGALGARNVLAAPSFSMGAFAQF